jgi:UbiD family decarboxylase
LAFLDLRSYVQSLDEAGLLYKITQPVNKDTELMPVVRWQYRGLPEAERKAFLFTDVRDSRGRKFSSPVLVAALGASRRVYAHGLGCPAGEIREKLNRSLNSCIPPRLIEKANAPVKEVIVRGKELSREGGGLDIFPIPISTPGYDPAPFLTSGHWVTKDPETGVRNVGNYRGMIKAPDRVGIQIFPSQHVGIHWAKAKALGRPLEAAIIIGAQPTVGMVAAAKIAYGVDEFGVAGALAGEPIDLVKCETVDLEVPAAAEIVIEGIISTAHMEPEAPFGEFSGYMGERATHPYLTVTCITHRQEPIYQAFISQFPPSESSKIRGIANEATFYNILKNYANVPSVIDVALHEAGAGAQHMIVIKMKKLTQAEPWQALRIAASLDPAYGKLVITVDEDIDAHDLDSVLWAVCSRCQPHLDMEIIEKKASQLDPSAAHPDEPTDRKFWPAPRGSSAILIDATRKWDYPPVSLPKKEYMERALSIWRAEGLPEVEPKQPWHGYELGCWDREYDEEAALAVEGRYFVTGSKQARSRQRV